MKYHYNPNTGKSSICEAEKKTCPYFHGESAEEAREGFESSMTEHNVAKVGRNEIRRELQGLPSEVLSRTPLKELDAAQLTQTLRHEAIRLGMDSSTVDSAVDLATILHAHQTRGNRGNFTKTPYIEHPLRNSLRLIRLGVKDQDVIVAAILHDTIEDGAIVFIQKFEKVSTTSPNSDNISKELDAREQLRTHIRKAYGSKVLKLVDAVTNDYMTDTDKARISQHQKNLNYLQHVENNVSKDAKVFLVKVSDFIDNATGLHHNDIPERAQKTHKQAIKYLPVVKVFEKAAKNLKNEVSQEGYKTIIEQLSKTETRLIEIVSKYAGRF